jgi:hypothetical protein
VSLSVFLSVFLSLSVFLASSLSLSIAREQARSRNRTSGKESFMTTETLASGPGPRPLALGRPASLQTAGRGPLDLEVGGDGAKSTKYIWTHYRERERERETVTMYSYHVQLQWCGQAGGPESGATPRDPPMPLGAIRNIPSSRTRKLYTGRGCPNTHIPEQEPPRGVTSGAGKRPMQNHQGGTDPYGRGGAEAPGTWKLQRAWAGMPRKPEPGRTLWPGRGSSKGSNPKGSTSAVPL